MKHLKVVLLLMLLGGCGTYHTLEELEEQAIRTGDWSGVERRELILARQKYRSGYRCPRGTVSYCENRRCACIRDEAMRDLLDSLVW